MVRNVLFLAVVLFLSSATQSRSAAGNIEPGPALEAPRAVGDIQSSPLAEVPGSPGDIKSSPTPKVPSPASKDPKDCHGPLYYKLKEKDKQNRQAESDVGVMEGFVQRTSKVLYPAQHKEFQEQLEGQRKAHARCLKERLQPAAFCLAMGRRDAALCENQITEVRREWCNHLLLAHQAVTTRSAEPCGKITLEAERAMCEFLVGGDFNCKQLAGEMGQACEALAAGIAGSLLPAELPADARAALQWIVAVKRQETAACDALEEEGDRSACQALLKADPGVCPKVRALEEYADDDFSCRKPVVYQAEHPAAWGNLVALTVASVLPGPGKCEVYLDLLGAEGLKRTMKAGDVVLDGEGNFKHFHLFTGKGRLIDVRAVCEWEPPGESPGGDAR